MNDTNPAPDASTFQLHPVSARIAREPQPRFLSDVPVAQRAHRRPSRIGGARRPQAVSYATGR
jgi:hypothetical protein